MLAIIMVNSDTLRYIVICIHIIWNIVIMDIMEHGMILILY